MLFLHAIIGCEIGARFEGSPSLSWVWNFALMAMTRNLTQVGAFFK
jgi:hypothetical protein